MPKAPKTAIDKALDLLGVRGFSQRELYLRLRKAEYSHKEAEQAVKECVRRGYVNDELLAQDQAELLHSRGCGCRKIAQKLRAKGVEPETITAAVNQQMESEPEALQSALEFKLRTLTRESDPRKKREKLFRFLASRGFPFDLIRDALENLDLSDEDGRDLL